MAYIYGRPGQRDIAGAQARRTDLLLRIGMPLLFLMILAAAGYHAFLNGHYWLVGSCSILFVGCMLRYEELGLTIANRLCASQTNARTDQVAAKTLHGLPNEYHVFHDLYFRNGRIENAVVGPNGLFIITTKSHLGKITNSDESLRLNGWPFLRDPLDQCWNHTQALTKHMDLQYSAGTQVFPVLCFSRASVETTRPVRGVMVAQTSFLVPLILGHEGDLAPDKIMRLIEKFSELVCVKTPHPVSTQEQALPIPEAGQASSVGSGRQVCAKCHHQASALELEFFPNECPACGRLYSFRLEDAESPSPTRNNTDVWRPTALQFAVAVLLTAGGIGVGAYQTGLFSSEGTQKEARRVTETEINATAASEATPPPVTPSATVTASKPASRTPEPVQEAANPQQAPTAAAENFANATQTPESRTLAPTSDSNATALLSTPGEPDNATKPSLPPNSGATPSARAESNATAHAPQLKSPAQYSSTGKLKVTASKSITLWFTDKHSARTFGPYETKGNADSEIVLPKGIYTVTVLDQGRRKQTTMSFLGDTGHLNF